jgi:hypothetical protein
MPDPLRSPWTRLSYVLVFLSPLVLGFCLESRWVTASTCLPTGRAATDCSHRSASVNLRGLGRLLGRLACLLIRTTWRPFRVTVTSS